MNCTENVVENEAFDIFKQTPHFQHCFHKATSNKGANERLVGNGAFAHNKHFNAIYKCCSLGKDNVD